MLLEVQLCISKDLQRSPEEGAIFRLSWEGGGGGGGGGIKCLKKGNYRSRGTRSIFGHG